MHFFHASRGHGITTMYQQYSSVRMDMLVPIHIQLSATSTHQQHINKHIPINTSALNTVSFQTSSSHQQTHQRMRNPQHFGIHQQFTANAHESLIFVFVASN
jgi:beta-glucanase (GH16 family)